MSDIMFAMSWDSNEQYIHDVIFHYLSDIFVVPFTAQVPPPDAWQSTQGWTVFLKRVIWPCHNWGEQVNRHIWGSIWKSLILYAGKLPWQWGWQHLDSGPSHMYYCFWNTIYPEDKRKIILFYLLLKTHIGWYLVQVPFPDFWQDLRVLPTRVYPMLQVNVALVCRGYPPPGLCGLS